MMPVSASSHNTCWTNGAQARPILLRCCRSTWSRATASRTSVGQVQPSRTVALATVGIRVIEFKESTKRSKMLALFLASSAAPPSLRCRARSLGCSWCPCQGQATNHLRAPACQASRTLFHNITQGVIAAKTRTRVFDLMRPCCCALEKPLCRRHQLCAQRRQ